MALALECRAELVAQKTREEEAKKPAPIGAGIGKGGRGKRDKAPASTADLQTRTGMSEGSINRARQVKFRVSVGGTAHPYFQLGGQTSTPTSPRSTPD